MSRGKKGKPDEVIGGAENFGKFRKKERKKNSMEATRSFPRDPTRLPSIILASEREESNTTLGQWATSL